jgi:hypothetical protein
MNRIFIVLLIVLLSGCSNASTTSTTPASTLAPTSTTTVDPCTANPALCKPITLGNKTLASTLQLLDCNIFTMIYAADSSKVAPLLPEGYQTSSAPAQTGGLDAYRCKSAVINNKTVLPDIELFSVTVATQAPPDAENPDYRSVYALELVVNSSDLQAFLRSRGFEAALGSVSVTTSGQTVSASYKGATPYYDYQGAGQVWQGPVNDLPNQARLHSSINGRHAWMDFYAKVHYEEYGEVGPLTLHDGAVSRIAVMAGGATAGSSELQTGPVLFTFGETTGDKP